MIFDDRRVHAGCEDEEEIVRYDRRGHWYIELPQLGMRERVTIAKAVERALELEEMGGEIFLGLPGGDRFDYLVRKHR